MAINYNVWGTPEQWRDPNVGSGYEAIEAKLPKAAADSYYDVYYNNLVPLNEIDISNCFWGISKNSLFLSLKYLSPYINNDVVSVDVRDVYEEQKDRPVIFTATPNERSASYYYRYSPDRSSAPPDSAIYYRGVVMAFNYQKVKITPLVAARATPHANADTLYRLDDYISNNRYNALPYISNIGYLVSYNGSNAISDLAIATIGHVKGYNVYYGTNLFYARSSGIDNFITAWRPTNVTTNYICQTTIRSQNINYNIGDSETAFAYKYSLGDQTQPQIYNYDGDPLWELYTDYMDGDTKKYCVGYAIHATADNINDVRDYLFKQMAFIGLPFYYLDADKTKQIGETGVYLPIFDEYGVTTGEYEEGEAALRLPNSEWTDGRTGSGYDPTRKPGEDDFGDLSNRRPTRVAPGGLNLYVTNYTNIYNLQRFLNGAYVPSAADFTADFKGTNPGDYIVGVYKYPVVLPITSGLEDIYVGKINAGFQAFRLADNNYLDFGTTDISPYFSTTIDFRDYQSKILLFMPFVGTAELDPKIFIGHTLGLIYNVDYLTGSVAAEIKRDGLTIETRTAKLAQTIPFFAGNMGAYQNELAQTGFAIEQSKIKQITGAVTTLLSIGGAAATAAGGGSELAGLGSGAGLIRGASNMLLERINQESLEYRLEHTQPQIGTISTASAGNAFLLDDRARVLIWRPYMLPGYDPETYSHVVGHATLRAAALSEFSGLTVAAAAELSNIYTIDGTKSASEQELKLIKQALLAGVYV